MQGEPGSSRVADVLPFARICAVNLGEVAAKLHDYGLSESLIAQELAAFELPVVPFVEERGCANKWKPHRSPIFRRHVLKWSTSG